MRVNEQGRSMIEMLGVLAIVGVLSVGGIAGYSKAMNKFKANKFIDQVNTISTNVRTMYATQRGYKNLNNTTAASLGILPTETYSANETITSTGEVSHVFGGSLVVHSAATAGSENGAFIIATDGIPVGACMAVLTTDWGGDAGSGLIGLQVTTGTAVAGYQAISASNTLASAVSAEAGAVTAIPGGDVSIPMELTDATLVCGKTGTTSIAWKFL